MRGSCCQLKQQLWLLQGITAHVAKERTVALIKAYIRDDKLKKMTGTDGSSIILEY